MSNFTDVIIQNMQEVLALPIVYLPKIIIAIILLIVGWFLGSLLCSLIVKLFKRLQFVDDSLRNIGLGKLVDKAGIELNVGKFIGVIVKILIIFVALGTSADVLGLNAINDFLRQEVIGYIPNVLSASIVVIIGVVIANFVGNAVEKASRAASIAGGLAAKITKYSIVIFTILIAVGELGVAQEIVQSIIVGLIAALSLALGLAFGLGGQQAAQNFIEKIKEDVDKS